jgi:heme oxygenase
VCFTWPGGYIAHHYTRYLGDLSGGQFIAGAVARVYKLTPPNGVRFYDFSSLGDLTEFKERYRALLDTAPWDDDERNRIVGEIGIAYAHNTELLVDLGRAFS